MGRYCQVEGSARMWGRLEGWREARRIMACGHRAANVGEDGLCEVCEGIQNSEFRMKNETDGEGGDEGFGVGSGAGVRLGGLGGK